MGNEIDYYFIYGKSREEVSSGDRTRTGKAQIMPKGAMGFWQSREKDNARRELLDVLYEFRRRRIPLDNIGTTGTTGRKMPGEAMNSI